MRKDSVGWINVLLSRGIFSPLRGSTDRWRRWRRWQGIRATDRGLRYLSRKSYRSCISLDEASASLISQWHRNGWTRSVWTIFRSCLSLPGIMSEGSRTISCVYASTYEITCIAFAFASVRFLRENLPPLSRRCNRIRRRRRRLLVFFLRFAKDVHVLFSGIITYLLRRIFVNRH